MSAAGTRAGAAAPLVFTHVPKTAGTALRAALMRALRPTRLVAGFDASLHSGFDRFGTFSPSRRQGFFRDAASLPPQADLVLGHFAHATTRAAFPQAPHITLLREPITRLLSHFLHWRNLPEEALESWGDWAERLRLAQGTLVAFLCDPRIAGQTDNIVARMLLWPHPLLPSAGFIAAADDAALLAAAQATLASYAHVGAIERPDWDAALAASLGRPLAIERRNATDSMPAALRQDFAAWLTPTAIDLLRQRVRLDDVLWRRALGDAVDPEAARLEALLPAVARYGALMVSAVSE